MSREGGEVEESSGGSGPQVRPLPSPTVRNRERVSSVDGCPRYHHTRGKSPRRSPTVARARPQPAVKHPGRFPLAQTSGLHPSVEHWKNRLAMATKRDGARRAADTSLDVPPLVETKLSAPRVRPSVVDRPRILQALDAGADAVLTLLEAPAGYGKTTAVRVWCATQDSALAWVTLDAGDNDPNRMWRYIATAVDRIRPGLAGPTFRRLSVAGGALEDAVDELMMRPRQICGARDPRARGPPYRDR